MEKPLNILIVEDSQDDADLVVAELKLAGFTLVWKRVETESAFLAALKESPDIVLSDFSMPQFSGLKAAALLRASGLEIPFILISGTVGEEVAVDAMKHGATDYLLKDRIGRLGTAVKHALEQKHLRADRQRAEASSMLFRALVDQSSDGVEVIDPETGRFLDVNETTCIRLGYRREELLALTILDVEIVGANPASWKNVVEAIRAAGSKIFEGCHKRKDGSTFPVEASVRYVKLDRDYLIASVRDITERKRTDEEIRKQLHELQQWHEAMLGREDRVLELKREVNELLARQKLPPRYSEIGKP